MVTAFCNLERNERKSIADAQTQTSYAYMDTLCVAGRRLREIQREILKRVGLKKPSWGHRVVACGENCLPVVLVNTFSCLKSS